MNILAIGAHFDDVELGCGGSLFQWKKLGHEIIIFVASISGYSNSQGDIIRSDSVAYEEGVNAANFLGADLITGGFSTFDVEFAEPLNRKLIDVSNQVQPDIVLTHWSGDVHHDHKFLSLATLHCYRHIPKLLMYCANWYEADNRFDPRFFIDISDTFTKKKELIEIFQSENKRTKGIWMDYIQAQSRLFGLKAGVKYAEGFEVVKWLY